MQERAQDFDFDSFLSQIAEPLQLLCRRYGATVSFKFANGPSRDVMLELARFTARKGFHFRVTGPIESLGEEGCHLLLFWNDELPVVR